MKNVIYIDVLFLINLYAGFFILKATGFFLHIKLRRLRLFFGSLLSGLFSLIILVELSGVELFFVRIAIALILCAAVFLKANIRLYLRSVLVFFIVSFIFGGLMLCLWYFVMPSSMQFKNGVVYFNVSAVFLAVCMLISYACIRVLSYVFSRRTGEKEEYEVYLSYMGRQTLVKAILDSGNRLTDSFSGLPVMVCELESLKDLLPARLYDYMQNPFGAEQGDYLIKAKLRMITVKTVMGESVLPLFRPDGITLCLKKGKKECDAFIAVTVKALSGGEYHALINPMMLT